MDLLAELRLLLHDKSIVIEQKIQALWSNYGQIVRCKSNVLQLTYIVKVIELSEVSSHPRGWNTDVSHQRKLLSYHVETCFYQDYAHLTDECCKVPKLLKTCVTKKHIILVMEDLNSSGYLLRKTNATWYELTIAIKWLAHFHARFINTEQSDLWSTGTYWHFTTRQEEFKNMPECEYKAQAENLDKLLNQAQYKTLVHGDAKFENLCFHTNGKDVAGVDFQYIGNGTGMKDLAYLVGSCFNEAQLFQYDTLILKEYLTELKKALVHYKVNINFDELSHESELLYPVAWADFYRFLLGWNSNSWKINNFMKAKAQEGLSNIKS